MKIYCISEGGIYRIESGTPQKVECGRIRDYLKAVNDMKKRDEWKTTGKGAMFMQVEEREYDTDSVFLRSIGSSGDRLVYSTFIDGEGGMYFKDSENGDETYIFANQTIDPCGMTFSDGKCCIVIGEGGYECHIAMLDTNNGGIDQITEGFTSETFPFISKRDPDIIYYTAMGYAQNASGAVVEKSPCSICSYSSATGELSDVISDNTFDYLKPCDNDTGDLYYIRRKYEPTSKNPNIGKDIVMFPYRIVKAVGGLFNYFSMKYGGEPLRTGGRNPAKSKNADEREMFVLGNLIKAKKIAENDISDEGIIPSEWVLIKRGTDGSENVLVKGVMDYKLLGNGDIIYSDGSAVRKLDADGNKELICKIPLADCITVIM